MFRRSMMALVALAAVASAVRPAAADSKGMLFATPGIPPIFASTISIVADREGLFKKYGADVEVKFFDSGTAAARAVLSGDIDFSLSPSVLLATQISNADAPLVAIYGMPSPDFVLASTDPKKVSCQDTVGQPVGVDTPGGQRSLMLKEMLLACGAKIEDVQQIPLGSNTGAAMLAGQLTFGVLHLDDVSVLQNHGKPVTTIISINKANPMSHNILGLARIDRLKEKRDGFVHLLAGLIVAARYMKDPANADHIADLAAPTGRTHDEAKTALAAFNAIGAWPTNDDGLDQAKLEFMIQNQIKIGGIQPGKTPVTYDRLVDRSVWRDAAALVDGKK
jgi:NitT/TauT family transport system substrate-binding protein